MVQKKRDEHRLLFDLGRVFGLAGLLGGRAPTYDEQVGLWLQLYRDDYRNATQIVIALEAAFGSAELSRGWFDAMAEDPKAVDAMQARINLARTNAALRAQKGF